VALWLLAGMAALAGSARADAPSFDLAGPSIDMRVARGGHTLPISQVPSLEAGDRLWIHPSFPDSQSARYLMVVAFLRGATNPPPEKWFTRVPTWERGPRSEGVFITVPEGAEQALIFLAPETGGDFGTLRSAVRGRPGVFVRATQDLQAAGLERLRLDRYMSAVKTISDADPKQLQQRSLLLARSLGMRLDQQCFERPVDQQAACLTHNTEGLVLDDAHTQSMVSEIANGSTADLMSQISYSSVAGAGMYSPYVGAMVDLARILGSVHTAQYQYIPALAMPQHDTLALRLNNPPSFRNPKSVLVIALPAVQKTKAPPLRASDPAQTYCLSRTDLVLPAEGAPVVFSSDVLHDLALRVEPDDHHGPVLNLGVSAHASKGGFLVDPHDLAADRLPASSHGTLVGRWGFDEYTGPRFALRASRPQPWRLAGEDGQGLVVGREDTLHLEGQSAACVSAVTLGGLPGAEETLRWKQTRPNAIEVDIPLGQVEPGRLEVAVRQFGLEKPDTVDVRAYAQAARIDGFTMSAGDTRGVLRGTRLDEVSSIAVAGIPFTVGKLERAGDTDQLTLTAAAATDALQPGDRPQARVSLKDGRSVSVPATILAPRPRLALISKGVQGQGDAQPGSIRISSPDDLPENGKLVFFLRSLTPAVFPRNEKVEVAAEDESFSTLLSVAEGTLVLQDAQTALGVLDPRKAFGASAFGRLRIRPIDANGVAGDWQPLGTLVRLPQLRDFKCPRAPAKPCSLEGDNLFLISAVAADPDFASKVEVPDGFTGTALVLPRSAKGDIYLKLRDDPGPVQNVTLPVTYTTAAVTSLEPESAPGPRPLLAPPQRR